MHSQPKFTYQSIAEMMTRLSQVGITRVRIIAVNDPLTCDYCRKMDKAIIPVDAMMRYVTGCTSDAGCRCGFEPVVNDTESK